MNPDLVLALELADEADALTLPRFRAPDLVVRTKVDLTPVTEVDRAVEEALRARLRRERPAHGILGEEMGDDSAVAGPAGPGARTGPRWVIDPIDGTYGFMRGIPVWATLVALQHDGETVLGVVSAPALGRRWWATKGGGSFADGQPIRVSAVSSLAEAHLGYPSASEFDRVGLTDAVLALERRCGRTRGFGDFWAHALVAEGALDVAIEPEVEIWDFVAPALVVAEAGGRFTDLAGATPSGGGSALSSNGLLHGHVLSALGSPRR